MFHMVHIQMLRSTEFISIQCIFYRSHL